MKWKKTQVYILFILFKKTCIQYIQTHDTYINTGLLWPLIVFVHLVPNMYTLFIYLFVCLFVCLYTCRTIPILYTFLNIHKRCLYKCCLGSSLPSPADQLTYSMGTYSYFSYRKLQRQALPCQEGLKVSCFTAYNWVKEST